MSLLTTKTARSIIYLCCIGGLLALNAFVVVVLWNRVFRDPGSSAPEISFLEGAGLTAFAYVFIFAVRYGLRYVPTAHAHLITPEQPPNDRSDRCRSEDKFSHLTQEQRTAIRAELVRSCGCQETVPKQ